MFCYNKRSLPNFTIQQGCDIRNRGCPVLGSFFCNFNEDDSLISISLIINSLSNLKTTLSIIYCGYTLYDWIDITFQTRNIHENTKINFEDRYLSEIVDGHHFIKKRYEILKITDAIDSVFLLQLAASSVESKNTDEVRIELYVQTDLARNNLFQRYGKLWPVIYEMIKPIGLSDVPLWYRKLHWKSKMRFARNIIFHMVSFPGKYHKVSLKLHETAGYENVTFKAQWLPNIYLKYKSNLHEEPKNCTNLPSMTFRYEFCINYSSSQSNLKNTFLLFKQFFHYNVNTSMIDGISWYEASEVCRNSGGFLPVFGSRDELHEVLSIFKLSLYLKPVVAIFIGINKVGRNSETK